VLSLGFKCPEGGTEVTFFSLWWQAGAGQEHSGGSVLGKPSSGSYPTPP
jgi:hypothetical protein